jgi:glutaredoxin
MITIYGKTGCRFTDKVVGALDAHGLSFIKKNIADQAVLDELIEKGGKRQVPYLVDGDTTMYESENIISYIENTYGERKTKPEIHFAPDSFTCATA